MGLSVCFETSSAAFSSLSAKGMEDAGIDLMLESRLEDDAWAERNVEKGGGEGERAWIEGRGGVCLSGAEENYIRRADGENRDRPTKRDLMCFPLLADL